MKDLYRRNGLRPREPDRSRIRNGQGAPEDRAAALYILLHDERKAEYDRVHRTLTTLGSLRRQLNLADNHTWRLRHGDFLQVPERPLPRPAGGARKRRRARRRFSPLYSWPVMAFVLVLLPLAYWAVPEEEPDEVLTAPVGEAVHVGRPEAPLRALPAADAPILRRLSRYRDLYLDLSRSDPIWAYVQLGDRRGGYIKRAYLAPGSGEPAQVEACRRDSTDRPASGERLTGNIEGKHALVAVNPPGPDALVKLKDHQGETRLFFYVRGGDTVRLGGIPSGRYQLQYALGKDFSPRCGRFLQEMRTLLRPRFFTFTSPPDGLRRGSVRSLILERGEDRLSAVANRDF